MKAIALSCAIALSLLFTVAWAEVLNGFDISGASIPAEDIRRGGPPRDGIPAIDDPRFETADKANWLQPDDRVLGLVIGGDARAYPVAILNWHEIVNDEIAGQPIAVTFCPLCNTGMVFDSRVEEQALTFGVSGLLYQSDVLLYDRETETLWSQIWSEGVAGPLMDTQLTALPVKHTTWQAWREAHPTTQVLSRDTGFRRDYLRDPYAGYEQSPTTLFPVSNQAPGPWHAKEWVLGVSFNGQHKGYPFEELDKNAQARFNDTVGGQPFTVLWDADHRSASIEWQEESLPSLTAFWFAWYAFYPGTEVFTAP
ncbi:DUF3179 domain-containing protein [Saccharospirillum impatiens]|uniref:DUF3179 domain-containing protein n=1 Tax=Saccharospirillum impatiens TaxID=169438 RepID=UPI00041978DE|nr:DUF3179 domain-containing protein [Saccharospirillum impatiens]